MLVAIIFVHQVIIDHSHHANAFSTSTAYAHKLKLDNLTTVVNTLIAQYPDDTVSVSLINLQSNEIDNFGSNSVMLGASTTKIITAADYLHLVELGEASIDQTFNGESATDAIQDMVQETDIDESDDAWNSIISYLSFDQITAYGQSIGLKNFDAQPNSLPASDEAMFLQKLYDGKLLNANDTNLLYSDMQHTGDEDLIPAALPAGTTVYEKFGYYEGYLHDAAIVKYDNHAFVLVIYTNNSSGTLDDSASRELLFHQLTQNIFDYETG